MQAMIGKLRKRWQCQRIAPLLVPFCESELPEPMRSRVLSHLDHCEACQEQLAEISAMGDFFRANPPTPASSPNDLWARLEPAIRSTGSIGTTAPIRRPVTARPSPATQWRRGFIAFAQAAPAVAVVVAVFLVGLERFGPASSERPSAERPIARTAPDSRITIVPLPRRSLDSALPGKPGKMLAAATPATSKPRPATRPTPYSVKPRMMARTTPVRALSGGRTIARRATEPTVPGLSVAGRTASPVLTPKEAPRVVAMASETMSRFTLPLPDPDAAIDAVRREGRSEEERFRTVSWTPGEDESVRADSAVETATTLYRQQTMFSYGAR
ncbi:MAG: hypothetical protein SFU56_08725 [Capsulimonadales bacterium]|nr:hypothetical protein [Capsulimonadales bacterium]